MLSFNQQYRSKATDNSLMEKAIIDNGALMFLMEENDAKILLSPFESNLSSNNYTLSGSLILKLKLFKVWNSAFGNVAEFIMHMGLDRLSLSLEESEDLNEPRHEAPGSQQAKASDTGKQ
jgi:hypothetical protein